MPDKHPPPPPTLPVSLGNVARRHGLNLWLKASGLRYSRRVIMLKESPEVAVATTKRRNMYSSNLVTKAVDRPTTAEMSNCNRRAALRPILE